MALVQRRIGLVFASCFILLAIGALRALYLTTFRSASLRQDAAAQQVTVESVPAMRGLITDRNGVDLAVSIPADDVAADPMLVSDPALAAREVAPIIGSTQSVVLAKLADRSRGFVYLARALPADAAKAVAHLRIAGISETPTTRRIYPRGALASQVLGIVGSGGLGLSGLELFDQRLLNGASGARHVVSDARGQPVSITQIRPTVAGRTISLTIDAAIQTRAEDVLRAVGTVYRPKDATAIVLDPGTGAILAMASWPPMNPNLRGGVTQAGLENRTIGFDYEPGSTFKAFTVAGALEDGVVSPRTSFYLPPDITLGGRLIHDAEPRGAETLTTAQILKYSSNVGAIEIGLRVGRSEFDRWVRRFGFGKPTGIELPGEERGRLLPLDQYSGSSMGNLPIGQGLLVTPLQMATGYAAIANGGVLRPPHIVQSIGGRTIPLPRGHRVISEATAAQLREMLRGVLQEGGTASEVSIPGYELAGKTGTASIFDPQTGQYSNTEYVASFVGFAPAGHPRLLCAVVVDQPQSQIFGGIVAAPAFGQIMSFALPYLNIAPS